MRGARSRCRIPLLRVRAGIHREEVDRIVGQCHTLGPGELLCSRSPGVPEGDDMVDLHSGGGAIAVRSRLSMSLRVSHPFRSSSSQAAPNIAVRT